MTRWAMTRRRTARETIAAAATGRRSAMIGLTAGLVLLGLPGTAARAQLTTTPGPGGIPIAPGAPVQGWTPGGVGIGGGRIAP
ncbi:hypothetical protein CH338_31030, partial [Rhodoplanes elegans]